jgi:nicotinate-nucleotide adenylyltransferase
LSTGLLGGTFDPPHNGHLALARAAIDALGLERLVVMVAGQPPHRPTESDGDIRLRLTAAAFEDLPHVEVSRKEIERPGPSYTIDTLEAADERWGDVVLVVGADMLASFLDWREPNRILERARLAVAERPGTDPSRFADVLGRVERPERVSFFPMEAVDVSATDIRRRVAEGKPYAHLVPPSVARLIEELRLYRRPRRQEYTESTRERT